LTTLARATIDLAALHHNLQQVRKKINGAKILAMIKSNGYGHGLVRMARAFKDSDALGVATLGEALELREAGITSLIVIMQGFNEPRELDDIITHQLTPVIHDHAQIDLLAKANLTAPQFVWLHVDTGMHRLGFVDDEIGQAIQRLSQIENLTNIGLMTHLADADNPKHDYTQVQLQRFQELANEWAGPKSICNSAGILAFLEAIADWVRPGIMLYGVSPFAGRTGLDENLQPAMTLSSMLIAVKNLKKGEPVGYGCTYCCPEDMPIGIVAIGYGSGYPRHAKSGTPVLVGDHEVSLIGRVSMDMLTVDLRGVPNPRVGDPVTLWGKGLPIERVAECAETIAYELLCHVGSRVDFYL
jgi:alanine racemase